MNISKENTKIKTTGIILGELLAIGTILFLIVSKQYSRLPMAIGTLILVLLPGIMERLFRCSLCLPVYIFALLYAVGPMMGQCWNFYYTVSWWDKLLHTSGGVMFAILGAYFFDLLTQNRERPAVRAIFAFCFSVSIAVLWEFCEFGADTFFGTDMQDDTVIYGLTSYLLGDAVGVTGSIPDIQSVTVNGIALPGYIDIGLIDSMLDMLLETVGAGITCVVLWLDQGKHPWIRDMRITQYGTK